jgi:hypothetical protein
MPGSRVLSRARREVHVKRLSRSSVWGLGGLAAWAGLCVAATAWPARADTIQFKNGASATGKFAGGDETTVVFKTADGKQQNYATAEIASMTFGAAHTPPPAPPGAAAPAAAAVPAAAAAPAVAGPVTAAAGSLLTVRMDSQVSSKDPGGKKFSATLVSDLMSDQNTLVAKAGSTVLGQVEQSKQAGRAVGKSELKLTLTALNIDGKQVPIMTTNFAEAGKGSFRKTARNTAAGAAIGAAADDDGAGKGAAIGAGVSLIRKGDSVTVPPGAILEFRLSQPVTWQGS